MESTLAIVLVGISVGAVQLAAGIIIGRYLPWGERRPGSATLDPARLQRFARRLCNVATGMASDVGQHKTQMEQVHRELTSLASSGGPALTAMVLNTVAEVMRINERLQSRLDAAEDRLQQQARQIESHITEARTDSLTGLLNRRAFDDELFRQLIEWGRKRNPFCLTLIDVDHFKSLNDRYGHPAGDGVLRRLAEVLKSTVREMGLVARVGGEEFAIVFPSTGSREARQAAERIRAAVAAVPIPCENTEVTVTVSLGLAMVDAADDYTKLIRRADEALYVSKSAGRNCGHFHNGQTCEPILWDVKHPTEATTPDALEPGSKEADGATDLVQVVTDLRARLAEIADE